MTAGKDVRDDSPLRDIQDLIARLEDVNRRLALPSRSLAASGTKASGGKAAPVAGPADPAPAEAR